MNRTPKFLMTCLVMGFVMTSFSAQGASVIQAKGNKVLLDNSAGDVEVDGQYFLMSSDGKKVGLIKVTQGKGNRALADLVKGRADVNMTTQAPSSSKGSSSSASSSGTGASGGKKRGGVLLSYSMDQMDVSFSPSGSVSMKGSSFGIKGFYEIGIGNSLGLEFGGGIEPFVVKGTSNLPTCGSPADTACMTNINFLSVSALGKYFFSKKTNRFWVGANFAFLLALSKSSTALNEGKISTNQIFGPAVGYDYKLGKNNFIPISFEYDLFPPQSGVKATRMILRGGYGMTF